MTALARLLEKIAAKMGPARWTAFLNRFGIKEGSKLTWDAIATTVKNKIKASPGWLRFLAEGAAFSGVTMGIDELIDMIWGSSGPSPKAVEASGLGSISDYKDAMASILSDPNVFLHMGDGEKDEEDAAARLYAQIRDANALADLVWEFGGPARVRAWMRLAAHEPSAVAAVLAAIDTGELRRGPG